MSGFSGFGLGPYAVLHQQGSGYRLLGSSQAITTDYDIEASRRVLAERQAVQAQRVEGFRSALAMAGFDFIRTLSGVGQTAGGAVFEVERRSDKRRLACKWLCNEDENQLFQERRLREIRAMRMLPSGGTPHIVRLDSAGSLGREEYLLMELCEGNLEDLLAADLECGAAEALDLFYGLFCGMATAHGCRLCHKDVHPGNIFWTTSTDGRRVVKLGDFGLAEPVDLPLNPATVVLAGYVFAPEVFELCKAERFCPTFYTQAQDVWSGAASLLLFLLPPSSSARSNWKRPNVCEDLLNPGAKAELLRLVHAKYGPMVLQLVERTVFAAPDARLSAAAVVDLCLAAQPALATAGRPVFPTAPKEDALSATIRGAMSIATTRRRAKSPSADRFRQMADECMKAYGVDAFDRSTVFQYQLNSALFDLPKLQNLVAQHAKERSRPDMEAILREEREITNKMRQAQLKAVGEEECSINNSFALIGLEKVKALAMAEEWEQCRAAADEIVDMLLASLQTASKNSWNFVCFQHSRNIAIVFLASLPARRKLGMDNAVLAGALEDALRTVEGGFDFLDLTQKSSGIDPWRDRWALLFEVCRLLLELGRGEECLQKNGRLLEMAVTGKDWMLQQRARHQRLFLLGELAKGATVASASGEGEHESQRDLAVAILDAYVANKSKLSGEAYGLTNLQQHCADIREFALFTKDDELLLKADNVLAECTGT